MQFSKILRDGSWSAAATIADRVGFFVAFVLLARSADTETNGAIVSAFAFCTILSLLFDFGYPAYLQRLAAARPDDLAAETGAIVWVKAMQSIPFIGIACWYFFGSDLSAIEVAIILASTHCFSVATALTGILWGRSQFRKAATVVGVSRLALLTSIPLHAVTVDPVFNTLIPILVSAFLQLILVSVGLPFALRLIRPSVALVRAVSSSSLPMGIGLFFVALYDRVDVLMIKHYLGLSPVSLYAAAYTLYRLPSVLDSFLLVPSFSSFSKEYGETGSLGLRPWTELGSMIVFCSLIATISYIVLAEWVCTFVYGMKFASSADALKVLGLALPGLLLNRFTGITLNAIHRERIPTAATFAGILSNIVANILLLPTLGFVGAAWATVIAEYVVLFVESFFLVRAKAFR